MGLLFVSRDDTNNVGYRRKGGAEAGGGPSGRFKRSKRRHKFGKPRETVGRKAKGTKASADAMSARLRGKIR